MAPRQSNLVSWLSASDQRAINANAQQSQKTKREANRINGIGHSRNPAKSDGHD